MKIKKLKDNNSNTVVPKKNTSSTKSITPIAASHLTSALPTIPYNNSKILPLRLLDYSTNRVHLNIICKKFLAIKLFKPSDAAIRQMKTRIGLLAQPKSTRPIIDATQRERRHGLA